jgi:hypothetical protein
VKEGRKAAGGREALWIVRVLYAKRDGPNTFEGAMDGFKGKQTVRTESK